MESDLLKEMNDAANNELMRETYERRISAIEAERERLRAALKPFAEIANRNKELASQCKVLITDIDFTDLQAAAKAMEESDGK